MESDDAIERQSYIRPFDNHFRSGRGNETFFAPRSTRSYIAQNVTFTFASSRFLMCAFSVPKSWSVLLTAAVTLAAHSPAGALDYSWGPTTNGSFTAAANWMPSGVPTNADIVTLRRGDAAAYVIKFPGKINFPLPFYEMNRLFVGNNHATLLDSLAIGQFPGTVNVTNASTSADGRGVIIGNSDTDHNAILTTSLGTLNVGAATIGGAPGSKGTLNITSGTLNVTGSSVTDDELIIGNQGFGELNISSGGRLNLIGAGGNVVMAKQPGLEPSEQLSATATITGPGSQLNIAASFEVGLNSSAILLFTNGASLTSGSATIRNESTVLVHGSTWSSDGELFIEDGEFAVNHQSQFQTGSATVLNGYIQVEDSSWTVDGDVHISSAGPLHAVASLRIYDGAQVVVGERVLIDESCNLEVNIGSITGNVENSGRIDMFGGATGTFVIDGDLISTAGNFRTMIQSSTVHSTLHVTGDLNLQGSISVHTQDVLQVGDSFDLLDWDGLANIDVSFFEFYEIHPLPASLKWDTSQFDDTGVISVQYTFAADFDLDADVDHIDLALWKLGYGATGNATRFQGDANDDGDVNGVDLLIWQREFGRSASVASSVSIPEPCTHALLMLAGATATFFRRLGVKKSASRDRDK